MITVKRFINSTIIELSTIYMNDIHNAGNTFHAISFADEPHLTSTLCCFDVNLKNNFNRARLSSNIKKELENIQIWLEINKLSLNIENAKSITFPNNQREIGQYITVITFNGQQIKQVKWKHDMEWAF